MSYKSFVYLIMFTLFVALHAQSDEVSIEGKVVQIQPIALDVMVSQFEKVVILLVNEQQNNNVQLYEEAVKKISSEFGNSHTIFGICNVTNDSSNKLGKYGANTGIKIITPIHHYQLVTEELSTNPSEYFEVQFPKFYKKITQPALPFLSIEEIQNLKNLNSYYVVVKVLNESQVEKTSTIYTQIFNFIEFFNVQLVVAIDSEAERPSIKIYKKGEIYSEYSSSAIDALYNFAGNKVQESEINDLVDFINIETIDQVSEMSDNSYYRLFGSSLETQMLLVYSEADKDKEELQKIRQEFRKTARYNKYSQLKYERVLFCQATTESLKNLFSQEILTKTQQEEGKMYKIVITKTDYSHFHLRKFQYESNEVTQAQLIQFMDDVRMKRINPKYKSQEIPNNQNKTIIKIVGKTFLSEIFEKQDKSVMVLFIDSKEEEAHTEILKNLEEFVEKYHDAYSQNMDVGVFDLAKNEHESLTIRDAPELVLFEKTNKKKPKFFQGKFEKGIIKNWVNYEVKDVTIPENFGEPILPLGPSTDL